MSRSIISIADGITPAAIDSGDGGARGVHRVEAGEQRPNGLRRAHDPECDARRDAERPLGADDDAEEIRPVRVECLAAELDDLAVGQDEGEAGHVVRREAVLQAVRPARVLRDVAADRADLLAGWIGRVEEAVGRDGAGHVEIRDSRLDDDALTREVDLEDPVHARERDDDSARGRRRAARESGSRAARDERHALAMAGAQHGLHLLGRPGEDDELGNRTVPRQPSHS